MPNITVIHHSADFDGIFCREIAKKFYADDAEYIGWDYGDPLPSVSPEVRLIVMLDISIEGMMDDPRLIWIDHHKSAIEKYSEPINGYRIDGVAACRLAWQFFFRQRSCLPHREDYINRTVSEPMAVRLAGEYDIWDRRDPRAELFQHGLRSRDLTNDWDRLLSIQTPTISDVERMIDAGHSNDLLNPDGSVIPDCVWSLLEAGKVLQYAKTKENESIAKHLSFTFEWEGLTWCGINAARYNSHLFTAGLKPEHDGCFGFNWDGKQWRVSLYHAPGKEHNDLSLIAVKHGGGGHRGACGFKTEKLPFLS